MYTKYFFISLAAAAALTSCSGHGDGAHADDADSLDFIARYAYVELPDSMANSMQTVVATENLSWAEDDQTLEYKRLLCHAATPDSGTYIDMVCDVIPSIPQLSEYAARQLAQSTLYVRMLDGDSVQASPFAGADAVEQAMRSIASDFTGRVYREIEADTAAVAHEQYGVADVLINFVSPRIITYSTYSVYYMAGAVNAMEALDLQSFDRDGYRALSLEDIAAPGKVADVRAALLDVIVKTEDYPSASEYISWLNNWLGDSGQEEISAEDFPVYSLGLTSQGLTFTYPKYTIAPGSRGVPVYTVPYAKLKGLINY